MRTLPRRFENRKGATMVLVAVLLTMLLGIGAFTVDLSQRTTYRSELQRAADAAALAGAVQLTKANFYEADVQANAFSALNPVMGQPPTVNSVEYGKWNDATKTFSSMCTGNCAATSVDTADAIKVTVSGTGGPILAQFVGQPGTFTMQTRAVAWMAKAIDETDCLKPFAVNYQTLTGALNKARGLADTYNRTRNLEQGDLDILRTNPQSLTVCLKEGSQGCSNPGTKYPGNFNATNLSPGDGGASDYEDNITRCSTQKVGIGDNLEVETGNMVGATSRGKTEWCSNFGTAPCTMKAALWVNQSPAGSIATTGKSCKAGQTGSGWCREVKMLGSFVITNAGSEGSAAVIEGYFNLLVDGGTLAGPGAGSGTLKKILLVQ